MQCADTTLNSGHNVFITAMGRFKDDITTNGTNFFFIDANHAALVTGGAEGFCNNTDVTQTVDSVSGPTCPPVQGHALLRRDVLIDERWPAVSLVLMSRKWDGPAQEAS